MGNSVGSAQGSNKLEDISFLVGLSSWKAFCTSHEEGFLALRYVSDIV